jgi:hypothetical protein
MKQTLTKLIALVGLVSFLAVGCSTTPSGPRPAPTPEEVSAVVSPALTYVVFKVTQKNPELAPYFKIVGSTVREFSETDVIAPTALADALRAALEEAGVLDLDEEDLALVNLITGTVMNLYNLYYGKDIVIDDRPAWLDTVLKIIADALDPQPL